MIRRVRLALVGVGNCASALLQGIHASRACERAGAGGPMHPSIGGLGPGDLEVVAAFDIDRRKVGRDVSEAVFALPNCTTVFHRDIPASGVTVQMGRRLDGISPHMGQYPEAWTFLPAELPEPDVAGVARVLLEAGAEVVVNYLPVGSEQAARFYAECCLEAGAALVNCMPVFLASDPVWAERFRRRGLPMIGDDIKSQLGATVLHRALADLFHRRGVRLVNSYQLNTGGNTDFLNMLNRDRLLSKKRSKTEAVQSAAGERIPDDHLHVGPSDYVRWQGDNKVAFIRLEGQLLGGIPMNLEVRLSVEDSPNSAGIVMDAVRCARLALDRGLAGVLPGPSACYCKHPPIQMSDVEAERLVDKFVAGTAA